MQLDMPAHLAAPYTSPAQRARVVTQSWVSDNMYCPACDQDSLEELPQNMRVADFRCDRCKERFQLKSQSAPFRARILDSAFKPMKQAVEEGTAPNLLLMHYRPQVWRVQDLLAVPGHFLTMSAIEERPPLAPTAHRAGWVGCNILLARLPEDGRIPVVAAERITPKDEVRARWRRFSFLDGWRAEQRGWTSDILSCVRRLQKQKFTLDDVYAYEHELAELHPRNKNIRPKIRQQLQVLRGHGVLTFLGRATYELTR